MSAHASTGETSTAGRRRKGINGTIQPGGKLRLRTAQGRDDPGPPGGRHQRFGPLGAAADVSRPDPGEGEKVDSPARSRPRAAAVAKEESNVDAVRQRRPTSDAGRQRNRASGGSRRETKQPNGRHPQPGAKCNRCGKERHPRDKCPARDAQCHNCQRRGHYSSQYRQKAISTVREGETVDTAFLDTMSTDKSKTWISNITVNGRVIPFKLDMGAEVTAISEATWKSLGEP